MKREHEFGTLAENMLADFIVVDLFANYCTGREDAKGAIDSLVRDGLVGVKRMEKAFQRQVLFATADAGCSSCHRYDDRPRCVADGLNTISAPFRPSARQPSGKWRS